MKQSDEDDGSGKKARSEHMPKESSETDGISFSDKKVVYMDENDSDGFEIL